MSKKMNNHQKSESKHPELKNPKFFWNNWKRTQKRLIVVILAAVLLLGAASYTLFLEPLLKEDKWVYKETLVERGTLTVGVTESGSLEYGITTVAYNLDLDVSGEDEDSDNKSDDEETEETVQKYLKVEEVCVAAGQRVENGTELLKFTQDSVDAVRKLLQNALVDAQSKYQEAEAEYNLAVLEAETDYYTREVTAKYASDIYQSTSQSIDNDISAMQVEIEQRTANINSLEEKVSDTEEEYRDALSTYEEAKEMMEGTGTDHASNFLTIQNQYLNAQTKYQSAKSAWEQAVENLEQNTQQIESLQAQITQAQARYTIDKLDAQDTYQESRISGENAQITYQAKLESLKEDLKESLESKTKLEEQLEAFETFVGEDGILYADAAGIVTQVGYEAGDTLKEAGTAVAYAEPNNMTIQVDVTQEDVTVLKVGDKVQIIFGAYEDNPYEGTILSIDTTATSRQSATISYTVVIGVDGDTTLLYGGMTADVTFITEEKKDTLYLTKKAIIEENGRTYVYGKTALGNMELIEVTTGISNGNSVEILDGLEEGDTVYIASKVSGSSDVEDSTDNSSDNNNAQQNEVFSLDGSFDGNLPEAHDFEGMTDGNSDSSMQGGKMNGAGQDNFGGRPGNGAGMEDMP